MIINGNKKQRKQIINKPKAIKEQENIKNQMIDLLPLESEEKLIVVLTPNLDVVTINLSGGNKIWMTKHEYQHFKFIYNFSGASAALAAFGYQGVTIEEETPSEYLNKESKMKTIGIKEKLNQKFIYVDNVAEILEIGFATKKNVMLYGRPGHAKSQVIEELLKHIDPFGEESFVQACGEGLTEEKLFGGVNLKKFQKTGEIEYLVEKSFMNKKYVVFEELLDSRMNVLLSLKDILTSGWFRQGSQQFKIRTEFIIVLTNRTKQEVSEDNSIKALLERFPLEQKVEWEKYEKEDYEKMFNKVLGNSYTEVAELCQIINGKGDFVSPRTAIHMAEVYKTTGTFESLRCFGTTTDVILEMDRKHKIKMQLAYLDHAVKQYGQLLDSEACDCLDSYKRLSVNIKNLKEEIKNKHQYTDVSYGKLCEVIHDMDVKVNELRQSAINLIGV